MNANKDTVKMNKDALSGCAKMNKKDTLMQYMLFVSSNNQQWSQAVEEWQVIDIVTHRDDLKCVCQQTSKYYYQLMNKINHNTVLICSTCLKYFNPIKTFASILLKQYNHVGKSDKNEKHRLCHQCIQYTVDAKEPDWKLVCRQCYMQGPKALPAIPLLGYRVCEECFVACIDPTKPTYHTKCYRCYKNYKTQQVK